MSDLNDPTRNVTLYDELGNQVKIEQIDGVYRLHVASDIVGGNFQLQPFTPKFDYSVASIVLNTSTDTSLKTIASTTGKIDFIAIAGSNSNYEIVLKIDGVEVLRITMADLGSGIGLGNATNVPLWAETANKNFRYSPKQGVDFTSSFEVLAKATTTPTGTVNWLVNYREAA